MALAITQQQAAFIRPMTQRGRAWSRRKHHHVNSAVVHKSGSRVVLLDRSLNRDLQQQLDDPVTGYECLEPEVRQCAIEFRRGAQRWVKLRRKQDRLELEEYEATILRSREAQLHRLRQKTQHYLERRCRLLNRQIEDLEALGELSQAARQLLVNARVELGSLELLLQY